MSAVPSPWQALRRIGVAVQFLTRIPVPGLRFEEGDLRRALGAFPLVGLLVAGAGVAVRAALGTFLDAAPSSIVAVAAMVAVTGALHEDGLADAFDGLWGGATPQDRLEIMRDSRLGTYGTLALLLVLGFEVAVLAPVTTAVFARAVTVGAVLGRASLLPLLAWMPPAAGSSAAIAGKPSTTALLVGAVTVAAALGLAVGTQAWVPLATAVVLMTLCGWVIARKLGGVNGDVLGATNRLVDVAAIAAVVALSAPVGG